jgi:hypothetical protein
VFVRSKGGVRRFPALAIAVLACHYVAGSLGGCMQGILIPGENAPAFIEHYLGVVRPAEIAVDIRKRNVLAGIRRR